MRLTDILLAFLSGAIAVSAVSFTADRYGSRVGGTLGGVPFSLAASLFFLGRAEGPAVAAQAASIIPMLMGYYGMQLAVLCYTLHAGLWRAVIWSTVFWGLLTYSSISLGVTSFEASVTIYLAAALVSYYLVEIKRDFPSSAGAALCFRPKEIALRMCCGGSVVSSALIAGSAFGPTAGGIAAAFPAVTIATIIVAYRAGGIEKAAALAKSLLLSGMVNAGIYAACVWWAYPALGLIPGTILAASAVVAVTYVTLGGRAAKEGADKALRG